MLVVESVVGTLDNLTACIRKTGTESKELRATLEREARDMSITVQEVTLGGHNGDIWRDALNQLIHEEMDSAVRQADDMREHAIVEATDAVLKLSMPHPEGHDEISEISVARIQNADRRLVDVENVVRVTAACYRLLSECGEMMDGSGNGQGSDSMRSCVPPPPNASLRAIASPNTPPCAGEFPAAAARQVVRRVGVE
tara:strand:+ start:923 stop:1516 length:594 start_codon:yes stop_codon:yes gene_type:complete